MRVFVRYVRRRCRRRCLVSVSVFVCLLSVFVVSVCVCVCVFVRVESGRRLLCLRLSVSLVSLVSVGRSVGQSVSRSAVGRSGGLSLCRSVGLSLCLSVGLVSSFVRLLALLCAFVRSVVVVGWSVCGLSVVCLWSVCGWRGG